MAQVLEQSIEPSLSSESVVIAGGGTLAPHVAAFSRHFNCFTGVDPRNEPSPSPDRPTFSNYQLG